MGEGENKYFCLQGIDENSPKHKKTPEKPKLKAILQNN